MPEQLLSIHNGYEIRGLLGRGGLGQVYLVRCLEDNRFYALKVSNADELSGAMIHREAHMLSAVLHPAFPVVREVWEEDGHVYLVMTYIEGRTLTEMIEEQLCSRGRGFDTDEVLPWMWQLSECLEYLAVHRIIYRDLKPSNVMIDEEGKLYLIDFGSACYFGEDITLQGMGTPGFAPPEQYSHSCGPGPWTDIYSFGALMHFLLTGEDPSENLFHFKKLDSFLWMDTEAGIREKSYRKTQIRHLDHLIENCTKTDPKKRCDWNEIRKELHSSDSDAIRLHFQRLRKWILGEIAAFLLVYGMMNVVYSRLDAAVYTKYMCMAETGGQEAEKILLEAIDQIPDNPAAYQLLYDSFMQDGVLSVEEWQKIQHLLLEYKSGQSGPEKAEWIVLDYEIAMALYLQSEAGISQKQAAVWFQTVADTDMKRVDLEEFDDRKFIWQKRAEIFGEWCQVSAQRNFRTEETEAEQRKFWRQVSLLTEDDFYPGELQWELAMYGRILSRMMEEVFTGMRMKVVSKQDLDMIFNRINLGLEQTDHLEGTVAIKQQLLDQEHMIQKRLVTVEEEN